jgi:hypothetical protein
MEDRSMEDDDWTEGDEDPAEVVARERRPRAVEYQKEKTLVRLA